MTQTDEPIGRAQTTWTPPPAAASVLAWLAVACGATAVALPLFLGTGTGDALLWPVPFAAMAVVGAIVARRQPHNSVGWLLILIALGMEINAVAVEYANAIYAGYAWPGERFAVWLGACLWPVPSLLLGALFVVYPSGSPASRRWRVLLRAILALTAAAFVVSIPLLWTADPAALHAESISGTPEAAFVALVANVGGVVSQLGGLVATVARYRRSRGVERQQMKWLAASAVSFVVVIGAALAAPGEPMDHLLYRVSLTLTFVAVPAAMAVAILRYRLYDIDRLIRRTVAYAVVTAAVVGVYLASVLLLGDAVLGASGGTSSDVVVAGSTLLAAAVFRPLLRRVQGAVERRFDRSGADAAAAVAALASRLRDDVELETLTRDIAGAARSTLRPSNVSLWLRPVRPEEPAAGPRSVATT